MNSNGPRQPVVLLVSNGHGEDTIATRLAHELQRRVPGARYLAFPLVGIGSAYERAGIEVDGPRLALPSGGLLMHHWRLLRADLRAGFLGLTARQFRFLLGVRPDILVSVGDVYVQLLCAAARARSRFVVQTLVSAHSGVGSPSSANRLFMERITLAERLLMRRAHAVYVRDELTEERLQKLGVPRAKYLGNPIADGLEGEAPAPLADVKRVIGMLPGSRNYSPESLNLMLAAFDRLANGSDLEPPPLAVVAWPDWEIPQPEGWSVNPPGEPDAGLEAELCHGRARVLLYRERLVDVLHASRVVLGTAGTAQEQAVALGRPVVSFPLAPYYSAKFLANQRRLLGPALTVTGAEPGEIAAATERLLRDPARAEQAGKQGSARIGGPGGSSAIAADVVAVAERLGVLL